MEKMVHVRFSLRDLIQAATRLWMGPRSVMTAAEALTYYWNWAAARGWRLVSSFAAIDPRDYHLRVECGDQLEHLPNEQWNVAWRGEDTSARPDLVAEAGLITLPSAVREVVYELVRRDWQWCCWPNNDSPVLIRGGYGSLTLDQVVEACEDHAQKPAHFIAAQVEDRPGPELVDLVERGEQSQ